MSNFWKTCARLEAKAKDVYQYCHKYDINETNYDKNKRGKAINEERSFKEKQEPVDPPQPKKKGWKAWFSSIKKSKSDSA